MLVMDNTHLSKPVFDRDFDGTLAVPLGRAGGVQVETVVVVDQIRRQQVGIVLLEVLQRTRMQIAEVQPRNIPPLDDLLRGRQRGSRLHDGRAAVRATVGHGQRPVLGQHTTGVEVELPGHLHLEPGRNRRVYALPPAHVLEDEARLQRRGGRGNHRA
mgnify:CR=1 FL=1